MSSIIEQAEVNRLRKAREEHEAAARFHTQQAKLMHYAYCAAQVRLRNARKAEGLECAEHA